MGFVDIIGKVKETASKKAKDLDMKISEIAIGSIVKDIETHRDLVKGAIVEKAEKEYDIYKSTEKLIEVASTHAQAKKEDRETIFEQDIIKAMKDICPTYWPFC